MRIAIPVVVLLALGACSHADPAPVVVAPVPQEYSCSEQRQAAAELRALPPDAMLRRLLDDYRDIRIKLRALRQLPVPAGC